MRLNSHEQAKEQHAKPLLQRFTCVFEPTLFPPGAGLGDSPTRASRLRSEEVVANRTSRRKRGNAFPQCFIPKEIYPSSRLLGIARRMRPSQMSWRHCVSAYGTHCVIQPSLK